MRAFGSGLGYPRHIALVPSNFPVESRKALSTLHVDCLPFDYADKNVSLPDLLIRCKPTPIGRNRLILFEPGLVSKLNQVAKIIRNCSELEIREVAVITESDHVAKAAEGLSVSGEHPVGLSVIRVQNVAATDEVREAVNKHGTRWSHIITPYEYAVPYAAEFARTWAGAYGLRFHSGAAAKLSRDKREFRKFIDRISSPLIGVIPHKTIALDEKSVPKLFRRIQEAAREIGADRVVVKPPDAAGSVGVRPINIKDSEAAMAVIGDLVGILESMPVVDETARCDVSHLIVEERICSEEFSVESRKRGDMIETIAIHWKVDIDVDPTRFFERLFVTLPTDVDIFNRLREANDAVIRAMDVSDGVFHAEYRANPDSGPVYPLEVGLRPGGGMVSASVFASRGVDLFEALLRCALNRPQNDSRCDYTVATGLVFAKRPGILPPLKVATETGTLCIDPGDVGSLMEWLRRKLLRADRRETLKALCEVLDRDNSLCRQVLNSFDAKRRGGMGMEAELRQCELWERPGAIIVEEEASYIGGLLISAASRLAPFEKLAESIAAMQMCLKSIICDPEERLSAIEWRSMRVRSFPLAWRRLDAAGFKSDIDSWTFGHAIERCIEQSPGGVLDLGCGSARPAVRVVEKGCAYHGIDIDPSTVAAARANLARASANREWDVAEGDVLDDAWLNGIRKQWNIVAANLPYLPSRPGDLESDEARMVDGGPNGIRFIPKRVLDIAELVGASVVIINVSTLCDLTAIYKYLADRGYSTSRVVASVADLEHYSRRVLPYLRQTGFSKIFGPESHERQIIISAELRRGAGVPLEMFVDQAISRLHPEINVKGTMALGISKWSN
jgi:biotin carboxylase/SAM-dependent methyltransferase